LKALSLSSFLAIAAVCSLATTSSRAQQQPTVAGLWQKLEDRTKKPVSWFLFVERGGVFEGAIAKLFPAPNEDPNPVCTKCTDDRKGMPILGIPLIRGMKRAGLNYENGTVLDPRDGTIYKAVMELIPDKQELRMTGYVGFTFVGRTETWYRLPDVACAQLDKSVVAKYSPECMEAAKGKGKAKQR
jgi:hypothetical protein